MPYLNTLRVVEIVAIIILITGSAIISIIGILSKLTIESLLAAVLGLLSAFGIYTLSANKLIERKIAAVKSSQLPLSREVSQANWYEELTKIVLSAKREIQITHHEPSVPITTGVRERRELWETLLKKMKDEKKELLFRWIVAIDNMKKLDWVCSLIDEHKSCYNLNINYSSADLKYVSPPMSIQIIDREALFVIDMSKGQYTISEIGIGLISTDRDVVRQFQKYYDEYWNRTIKLKEGTQVYCDNIEALRKKIQAKNLGASTNA